MPGSVHIVVRIAKSGKRYFVRYRRGGRGYRLEHAGSFKRRHREGARDGSSVDGSRAGLDPREELGEARIEEERPELIAVGREWLESRIDLSEQSQRVYSTYLDSIAESPLGRADPVDHPGDVRAQVGRWVAAGLASKSVRERVSVLRQVLDFAEIDPNPARHRSVRLPASVERTRTSRQRRGSQSR